MLARLQRTDVDDNRPAVLGRDARCVWKHRAVAIAHDLEEVSDWCAAQALCIKRRRSRESALHDRAIALATAAVTDRAMDIVAFAPTHERLPRDRHRESGSEVGTELSR